MDIFNKSYSTINSHIHELKLEEYFNIKDSLFELQFRDFLIKSNYIEDEHFERRNHNILPINQKTNGHSEIDFLFSKYNLGFEINDLGGHKIHKKNANYHYNKTLQCSQKGIRLIHLWEWELNETNWPKTSRWILHILNQNKTQLNIFDNDNYNIRLVNKEDLIAFLDQYSFDNNRDFDKCIGIYYNDELIQTISFINDRILSICVKFGYELVIGTTELIQSYMINNQLNYVLTYVDLSKFTGKTFEDMGFELIRYIEPFSISEKLNSSKSKQVYNCGYNVYMFTI